MATAIPTKTNRITESVAKNEPKNGTYYTKYVIGEKISTIPTTIANHPRNLIK